MKPKRTSLLRAVAVAGLLALTGCGSDGNRPDGGNDLGPDTASDTGPSPDTASDQGPPPPDRDGGDDAGPDGGGDLGPLTVERWGTRIYGPILSLSRTDRSLWLGTGVVRDPEGILGGGTGALRTGLYRLDLDEGSVSVLESELPRVSYPEFDEDGPAATAQVVQDGQRHLVASRAGLLVVEDDQVTAPRIDIEGQVPVPTAVAVDRQGGRSRIWLSSNLGVIRLDAETFAVQRRYGSAELGEGESGQLALDPLSGAVYVALFGGSGARVARLLEDQVTTLVPGEKGVPAGLPGDILVDAQGRALIALAAWDAEQGGVVRWDGTSSSTLVNEAALSWAVSGELGPFGAHRLSLDEKAGLLVVGGAMRANPANRRIEGGGLVYLDLATGRLAGVSVGRGDLPGDDIAGLQHDPVSRRTYVALRQPCSDIKIGNLGLVAVSFRPDGSIRLERPILSGVRSLALAGDRLLAGLRDDLPGLACDGYTIQTGLLELRSNRSGELVPLHPRTEDQILPHAGPVALATRSTGQLAIGSFRDGTFIGAPEDGVALNQALEFNLSLFQLDVAWDGDERLWLTGRATHDGAFSVEVDDRSPRGAALLQVDPTGKVTGFTHFALNSEKPSDVVGLPSSEVVQAVTRPDGQGTYLICATERIYLGAIDREIGTPFSVDGAVRQGGIARVDAEGRVTVVAGPGDVPDPRAGALAPDGSLWVLDAERGLLRVTDEGVETLAAAVEFPAEPWPRSLWVGGSAAAPDQVLGFDRGAAIRLGGQTTLVDDAGQAWRTLQRGPGVLAVGTDLGLVRVRREGTADVAEPAPGEAGTPPFRLFPGLPQPDGGPGPDGGGDGGSDGGACLPETSTCSGNPLPCCPGLVCGGSGIAQACVPE